MLLCLHMGVATADERLSYCCVESGQRLLCADTLPKACHDRAYRVMNGQGMVVRQVDAPLSPSQQAQRMQDEQKRKDAAQRQEAQRRRDRALLASYSSEQELAQMRANALAPHQLAQQEFSARLQALLRAPASTDPQQQRERAAEQQGLRLSIANHERDIEAINRRFDAELQRFRELQAGHEAPH